MLALMLSVLLWGGPVHVPALPCHGIPWAESVAARERLIRCAARHFKVPGGYERALEIARCESGPDLDPNERYHGSVGIFQHQEVYWRARVTKYLARFTPLRDTPRYPATNGWANVLVSLSMASDPNIGWGPWSCAR